MAQAPAIAPGVEGNATVQWILPSCNDGNWRPHRSPLKGASPSRHFSNSIHMFGCWIFARNGTYDSDRTIDAMRAVRAAALHRRTCTSRRRRRQRRCLRPILLTR
jgi:hypothetical protein